MADIEKDDLEELDEELVVVMTDEEGNEYYYREEMIVPVGDKQYAILIPIEDGEEEEDCGCNAGCGCSEDEVDVYIARIDTDENGEEIYVDPTDEEFEEVRKAYEELMVEDEAE
ncbi:MULTISPECIES: DUF1292 domain-containing protein [Pelosinus]|uniref:Uncharacterized protein n=2 Tax=Pelosinus TaxID=365348 RepID=I8U5E0_9FIRM|nr:MULTISPECIES: DUF1292 domain-containing protein [Pelosinus]AJQ27804.1 protein of unknown function DUF1292 [Pelosinus fermentans JBW45]SFL81525.1 Protein of unknown function [Pelosinus propionicus DSM 13327]